VRSKYSGEANVRKATQLVRPEQREVLRSDQLEAHVAIDVGIDHVMDHLP